MVMEIYLTHDHNITDIQSFYAKNPCWQKVIQCFMIFLPMCEGVTISLSYRWARTHVFNLVGVIENFNTHRKFHCSFRWGSINRSIISFSPLKDTLNLRFCLILFLSNPLLVFWLLIRNVSFHIRSSYSYWLFRYLGFFCKTQIFPKACYAVAIQGSTNFRDHEGEGTFVWFKFLCYIK